MVEYRQIDTCSVPMSLLLEADPSELSISKYFSRSLCFAAYEQGEMMGACVVKLLASSKSEICNIAVFPKAQNMGIGSGLLKHVVDNLAELGVIEIGLGTGTFGYQLAFYQRLGFRVDGVIKNYFIDNYDEPIYENGLRHVDMLRLTLTLG